MEEDAKRREGYTKATKKMKDYQAILKELETADKTEDGAQQRRDTLYTYIVTQWIKRWNLLSSIDIRLHEWRTKPKSATPTKGKKAKKAKKGNAGQG